MNSLILLSLWGLQRLIPARRLTSGGPDWVLSVHLFSAPWAILGDILEFELFLFMFAKGELQSVLKIVTREHTLATYGLCPSFQKQKRLSLSENNRVWKISREAGHPWKELRNGVKCYPRASSQLVSTWSGTSLLPLPLTLH